MADDIEGFVDGIGTGSPIADTTTGTLANANDLYIGSTKGTHHFFNGDIYSVAIWRDALTAAEIAEANEALLGGNVPSMMLMGVGL